MSEQNPVFPQPVAEGEDGWDLQQRNVQERIEAAIVHPELGDGELRVEHFGSDADIAAHMLPASHGRYGLDTHTYRFAPAAQRQFWSWHFRNEERIRQERLAEHERRTAEFNRRINERKAKIEAAKPAIELIGAPVDMGGQWGQRVRMLIGAGPGPLEYWWLGYRPAWNRDKGIDGWTKWRTDKRAHNLPHEVAVTHLDKDVLYDFAVIGGCPHGSVESEPVSAKFGAQVAQPAPPAPEAPAAPESASQQQEAPAAPEITGHVLSGVWGHAWHKFPGIAPGRRYGTIVDAAFIREDDEACEVTALFLTDSRTLRLTLSPGTPEAQFPSRIRVETGSHVNVFEAPGPRQTFGLGEARDYQLAFGSPGHIRVGVNSVFVLEQ